MHALEKDAIYRFEAMEGLDVSLAILAGNADHVGNRLDLHPFTRLKSQVLKVLLAIPEGRLESFRYLHQVTLSQLRLTIMLDGFSNAACQRPCLEKVAIYRAGKEI